MNSVKNCKPGPKQKPFPKLMVSPQGRVVLMIKRSVGTVVYESTPKAFKVGHQDSLWEMSYFADYEGTIELSN